MKRGKSTSNIQSDSPPDSRRRLFPTSPTGTLKPSSDPMSASRYFKKSSGQDSADADCMSIGVHRLEPFRLARIPVTGKGSRHQLGFAPPKFRGRKDAPGLDLLEMTWVIMAFPTTSTAWEQCRSKQRHDKANSSVVTFLNHRSMAACADIYKHAWSRYENIKIRILCECRVN